MHIPDVCWNVPHASVRNLSARDPNVVPNQVQFSYEEFAYKPQPPGEQAYMHTYITQPAIITVLSLSAGLHVNLAVHFSMDGNCMFADSDEAVEQRAKIQRKVFCCCHSYCYGGDICSRSANISCPPLPPLRAAPLSP